MKKVLLTLLVLVVSCAHSSAQYRRGFNGHSNGFGAVNYGSGCYGVTAPAPVCSTGFCTQQSYSYAAPVQAPAPVYSEPCPAPVQAPAPVCAPNYGQSFATPSCGYRAAFRTSYVQSFAAPVYGYQNSFLSRGHFHSPRFLGPPVRSYGFGAFGAGSSFFFRNRNTAFAFRRF